MTTPIEWDCESDLSLLARTIEELYFENPAALDDLPDELIGRCWQALDSDSWCEPAAEVLLTYGRATWERSSIAGALILKQLCEKAIQRENAFESKAVHALVGQLLPIFKRLATDKGVSEEVRKSDPLMAVEECYFGPDHDKMDHFIGGCLLFGYRSTWIKVEPSCFVATLYAIREAYAFFLSGQPEAAHDSLAFAAPFLETLEPEANREQAAAIGLFLQATANAAEQAGDQNTFRDYHMSALRMLPRKGDNRASSLFRLADAYYKEGNIGEALRLFKDGLDTPDVKDPALVQLLQFGYRIARAETDGEFLAPRIDWSIADSLGVPTAYAKELLPSLEAMQQGKSLSDEQLRRTIIAAQEWTQFCASKEDRAGAFWTLLLTLKLLLSFNDPEQRPLQIAQVAADCERFLDAADEASALEYSELRNAIHLA